MKHTIRFIILIFALVVTGAGNVSAVDITAADIIINVQPNSAAGTVTVTSILNPDPTTDTQVTISVTPEEGYSIDANHITAEKMVDAMAPRRAPGISSGLDISGTNPFTFIIPAGYTGAYVTVNFFKPAPSGVTAITSLSQISNDLAGSYQLIADIDASGFESLGNFTGTLDGGFYKIYNLSEPLFTSTSNNAIIRNIIFEDVNISSGDSDGDAGAVTCKAQGATRIYNCGILPTYTERDDKGNITGFSGSSVRGTRYVGGLVGKLDGKARVINCYSYANITGGTTVAGIVGYNNQTTTQGDSEANFSNNVNTMVMNCMFYGDITGGTTKYPVYGGTAIANNDANKVNNYNYFSEEDASYATYANISGYNNSWPVARKYLTRFEVYRNILNSNRRLCTWWINGRRNTCPTDADVNTVGIAKWVLDQSIAPYPILKVWGKYPSVINQDSDKRVDPSTKAWVNRGNASNHWGENMAPDTEGQILGSITVTINGGDHHSGSDSRTINITAMDTEYKDYCYGKIQLPYYNEIFGNPNGTTWSAKYGDNYTSYVVTGWEITSTDGSDAEGHSFSADWQTGYNFADRKCASKDLYGTSGRVFAQGGYYYVPDGVTAITITAHWGNAVYLCNKNSRLDMINNAGNEFYNAGALSFGTSGILPLWPSTNTLTTSLDDAIDGLSVNPTGSVYDQAIVLVGNYQNNNIQGGSGNTSKLILSGNQYATKAKPFTIMSADFDLDNEPDFCFQAGMNNGGRPNIQPIRFDFLMVPDITMAIRKDANYLGMRIICPQGHFEVTETSYMYTTQFEYDKRGTTTHSKHEAPLILNGGEFFQIVSKEQQDAVTNDPQTLTNWECDRTLYFLLGGNLWMKAFTPGVHGNGRVSTRHCAVNAIGGEFPEFYLSGMFRTDFYNKTDNPHAYLDGGKFGIVAGAGMESVGGKNETNGGDVTFKINHSLIDEFYGGGINAQRPVTGNISVTIDNSKVTKYCGGPKLGDMSNTKTITTIATGTTFDEYYGGGNGGTNLLRERQYDAGAGVSAPTQSDHSHWDNTAKFKAFTPFSYTSGKGYQAEYEFEMLPRTSGNSNVITRSYYYWASFSKTKVAPITNTITDCTFNGNFYGGGNLGAVDSPTSSEKPAISSTLSGHTVVHGSVFGAGYSASATSFKVHDKNTVVYPYRDNAGFIHDGSLDYDPTEYIWIHDIPAEWGIPTPTTANPTFTYGGRSYVFTETELTNLGTVTGDVLLKIEGTTTVAGSVYGGGEESTVDGSTEVKVTGGTIGSVGQGGAEYGNVYGGGMGKDDDVKAGLVKGNTKVTISQAEGKTTTVYHNVYGGGAYGSVGTYTYDANNVITGHTANTGKAEVIITGGTFGWNGKENGMVFGSSRGDVGAPYGIEDKMAWVYDTDVKIGTLGQGFNAPQPQIKGSVYGGGENGHNYHNADVYIYSGTIGIPEGSPIVVNNGTPDNTEDDITYRGAEYPYRGNVYGGGCGTDTYIDTNDDNKKKYNPLAGIVQGNATVNIDGGRVVRNVYGAGAMGSVGTATTGGQTTINISGGTVGVDATAGDGNVFGAARGSAEATSNEFALVRNTTTVNIGGKASVKGNVYGGGELGCVGRYVISSDMRSFYWTDTPLASINPENPETFTYNNTGVCKVNISGGEIGTGVKMDTDGSFANGNVFGAGKGQGDTFWCEKGIVYKANVNVTDGIVNGNVYGGGEVGRVETDATVKIGPDTGIGSPEIKGNVFGGGAGLKTHGYSALVRGNTYVTVQSSAKVSHNVYGGGMIAAVGKYYLVTAENLSEHPGLSVGMPYSLVNDGLGICNVTVKGDADITGSVFGGGKGKEPDNLNFAEPSGADYHTDSYDIDDHMPKRMMNDYANKNPYWEYTDPDDHTYIWEYFETPAKYHTFLETLGLTTQSVVNIEGSAQVKGNVYGGSESGFVQHNTSVTIAGGTIGTGTAGGNVFGGGLGLPTFAEAGRVRGNATVTINNGAIKGNVYGGGQLGDVGTIDKRDKVKYNYMWTNQTDPVPDPEDPTSYTWNNTGACTVTINGGTIGTGVAMGDDGKYANGNVFGAGKGLEDTWWCEKAIAYKTNVTITDGTINGTVYGGGQVGRVENNAIVTIGTENETGTGSKPNIIGNVFGAGAGVKTHGYSALVRGNATVTVQGISLVGGSVYGGGEIASVGRFTVVGGLPKHPDSGGTCTVTIQDHAKIGASGTTHNVFGACKGVTPAYSNDPDNPNRSKSMQLLTNAPENAPSLWSHYNNDENSPYIWRYYPNEAAYIDFLETLALTSHPIVTIAEDATVNGSVFGGGERGITLGSVEVNINGGTVTQDVYGGGSLANTNKGNWDTEKYVATTPAEGASVKGLYSKSGNTYTEITDETETADGSTTYYIKGTWADGKVVNGKTEYTTTVNLHGGTIGTSGESGAEYGNVFGGGLGDANTAALVYGDVTVKLNETTATDNCVVKGSVFGCNNVNGTPKGNSKVHVFKTVSAGHSHGYDVTSVFGGGMSADYVPEDATQSTEVIIEGCDLTSIADVYGGGYGAAVPGTYVLVKGTKIIDNVFGGGYGAGDSNPGANVGYYTSSETPYGKTDADVKTAVVRLMAGKINNVYGGSNTQGNIRGGSSVKNTTNDGSPGCCATLDVGKIFGGGKSATMYGGAEIVLGCMPNDWIEEIYAGADQADVGNDVSLTITSGKFGRVFGGNNTSGTISGSIEVNIEENPNCGTPIIIGELYGGGNQAYYTVPAAYTTKNPNYPCPRVNVRAFTSIGNIYGGGLGETAIVTGNPTVNINEVIVTDENGTNHAYDPSAADTGRPAFIDGVNVKLYPHEAGKMGVIGNVFGGGNAAQVVGSTYVNIGTKTGENIEFESLTDDTSTIDINEKAKRVVGADIRGNIYGGGNQAEVTGDTNVTIGKKNE